MTENSSSSFCYKLVVFLIHCYKKSLFCRLIIFLSNFFENAFVCSTFYAIVNKIIQWSKFSFTSKFLSRVKITESSYSDSFVVKIFSYCVDRLNAIANYIYKPLANSINSSYFNQFALNCDKLVFILGAYVLFDHFFRGYFSSYGYLWDELLFVILILVSLYKWFVRDKKNNIKIRPLSFSLFVFYVICLFIFIVNNPDTKVSIEGMRVVVQYTLWYFTGLWLLKSNKDVKALLLVTIIVGTFLGLHGVYQYIANVPMPASWIDSMETGIRTRVFSVVGSPNVLGSLMTLFIPIGMSFVIAEKKFEIRCIFLFSALAMLACLIFTSSRGAWFGFAAAVIVYVFLKDKRLIIPACFLLLLSVIFVPTVFSRITYMLTSEYTSSSLRGGRLARWRTGLTFVSEFPFFGLGFGQFGGAVAMNNNIRGTFYMDNYYLKTAVEMGIVGLTSFIILMFSVLKWSYNVFANLTDKYYKELSIGIISGLTGVLIHNFFENIFEVPYMVGHFWILVAAVMILKKD